MDNDYRNGRHVVYKLTAHIVLTPKYRKKVMTKTISNILKTSFENICKAYETDLLEFNTDKDHAHLLISYPPKISLSKLIMSLKTNSARKIRKLNLLEVKKMLYGKHFWSPSYLVISTSGKATKKIKEYIENQGKPNKKAGRPYP
jgi:putative transposase